MINFKMEKNENSAGNYLKLNPSLSNSNNEYTSEKDIELLEDNNENKAKPGHEFNSPEKGIENGPEILEILDNNKNEEKQEKANLIVIEDNNNKKLDGIK